ncbi:MAG: hypothetical protein EOP05_01005 [Proteobacteria bacterium]|nr:MAG: hypothetical protein EOP05_01005 [Pseudomonadota bacterium]
MLINDTEFDPRFESIVRPNEKMGLTGRDVLALSTDIISMMDLDGRFLHANTTTAKRLKSIPCELVGERWENTEVGADAAALFESQQAEVIKANKEMMFEFTLGKDDDLRYYTRQITPIRRNDGSMLAYASTIRDITAERLLWIANDQMFSAKNLEELLNIVAKAGTPTVSPSCILQIGENVKTAEFKSAHHRQEASDSDYLKFLVSGPLKTVIENASLHASRSTVVTLDMASSKKLGYKTNPAPSNVLIAPIQTSTGESGRLIFLRDGEFPPGATLFAERIAKSASTAISTSRSLAI